MFAIVKDGQIVKTGASLRAMFPNVSLPSKPSSEWKIENGVQDIVEGQRKDERFYWVTPGELSVVNGQATQTYVNTAKLLDDREESDEEGNPLYVKVLSTDENGDPVMVDSDVRLVTKGLKSQWVAQVKDTAGKMLADTDWMVIRKAERDVAIPADVVAKRAAIVAECDRLETAIKAAADVDALATVIASQNWG